MSITVPPYSNGNNDNMDVMSSSPIASSRLNNGSFRTSNLEPPLQTNGNGSFHANNSANGQQLLLPKPSIPPPGIPGRPPPIGFNVSPNELEQPPLLSSSLPYPLVSPLYPVLDSSSSTSSNNNMQQNNNHQPYNTAQAVNVSSSASSASSSTTASVSLGNSVNENLPPSPTYITNGGGFTTNGGGVVKPPKPVLPRKPATGTSLVAQHINKFETGGKLEDLLDQSEETPPSPNSATMHRGSKGSQEVTFL
jgi:hypothetical protein